MFPFAAIGGTGAESSPTANSENEKQLKAIEEKNKEISELNETLSKFGRSVSDAMSKNNAQIKDLEEKNLKLSQEIDKYKSPTSPENNETQQLKTAPNQPSELNDSYILPLRKFHSEARCYGSSLNFTVGEIKTECVPKEELATRFLGFLVELNIYDKEKPKSLEIAKKELVKLQQKYKFSKPGWYGIHVFNILATELRTKALSAK
jgi:hypothetical protein